MLPGCPLAAPIGLDPWPLAIDALAECLELLDDPSLCARVGFYLDYNRDVWGLNPADLDHISVTQDRGPYHLGTSSRGRSATLVEAWNLVVPDQVLHHTCEEQAWI
ncbi:MAG: hypothetical protein OXS29_00725 [bacterium]|nr:hypothetical protein [bacterium]MDE0288258.1 hypothetical protein [bacterium]MDE0438261.1 hypothetical protein [bacterium]